MIKRTNAEAFDMPETASPYPIARRATGSDQDRARFLRGWHSLVSRLEGMEGTDGFMATLNALEIEDRIRTDASLYGGQERPPTLYLANTGGVVVDILHRLNEAERALVALLELVDETGDGLTSDENYALLLTRQGVLDARVWLEENIGRLPQTHEEAKHWPNKKGADPS